MVPFEGFSFTGLDVDGCELGRGVYLATNLPSAFTSLYTAERLIEVEPLAAQISAENPLAQWERTETLNTKDGRVATLIKALAYSDIAPRTSLTLWKRGKLYGAATFTRKKPFSENELATLEAFAPAIHSHLALPVIKAVNSRLGLGKGEILCLRLAAAGLTSEEMVAESPYTFDTITTYLKSAARKLKAANRTQAVAEAIRRKIIE